MFARTPGEGWYVWGNEVELVAAAADGMNSRDIIRALERDGWQRVRVTGAHHHFRHPTKPGLVTVQHPRRDVPIGTLRSIERQSGLKLR